VPCWVEERAWHRLHHVSADFGDVRTLNAETFEQRVRDAYEQIFEQLEESGKYPVRFWAFVPGIHDDLGGGLDGYMVFNAGRYRAFASRFGSPTAFSRSVPTASAVGVAGDVFSLHCLGADVPGQPIENPRQVSAYHYSRRYGPMPPCFARATLLQGGADEPMVLVGGTASIIGEESHHVDVPVAQARETLVNLASVVASAVGRALPAGATDAEIRSLLTCFRELRVYYKRSDQRALFADLVHAAFAPDCRVEWCEASLCRSELLIEIEGVAFPDACERRDP
jgi:chorismate lyase/3-hydroxybenzoate synthase